jgi:hypothetical protein
MLLPIFLALMAGIQAFYKYFRHRKSKEPIYRIALPVYLLIGSTGTLVALFLLLLSLGLVR